MPHTPLSDKVRVEDYPLELLPSVYGHPAGPKVYNS